MFSESKGKIAVGLAAVVATLGAVAFFFYRNEEKTTNEVVAVDKADDKKMEESDATLTTESGFVQPVSSKVESEAVQKGESEVVQKGESEVVEKVESVQPLSRKESSIKVNPLKDDDGSKLLSNFFQGFGEDLKKKAPNASHSNYEVLIQKIKHKQKTEHSAQHLSMKLIMFINDALVEFCATEFAQITIEARADRRKVRTHETIDQYLMVCMEQNKKIEFMFVTNMQQVCIDSGITMDMYEMSNHYWSQMNPQFAILSILMLDKMKLMIPANTECTVEQALSLFDFQIEAFPKLKVNVQSPELMPLVKQNWLSDMAFEEFGLEEEDYIKAPGLESNAQFKTKAEKLSMMIQQDAQQHAMSQMGPDMGQMGGDPNQMNEMMQMMSQMGGDPNQMNEMMQMMGPMGGPPPM